MAVRAYDDPTFDPDDVEIPSKYADEALDIFQCGDYKPFVNRIFHLEGVRTALGYIPYEVYKPTYYEIEALAILADEKNKKEAEGMAQGRREGDKAVAAARASRRGGSSGGAAPLKGKGIAKGGPLAGLHVLKGK